MIRVIYPKGSIISIFDDNKRYCIVDITKDGYDLVIYPFGVLGFEGDYKHVDFEMVDKILFWGYMGKEYEKRVTDLYREELLGETYDQ